MSFNPFIVLYGAMLVSSRK